jgi:hypothetical protein
MKKQQEQSAEALIRLIRLDGQTKRFVEYSFKEFVAAYTADRGGDAAQKAARQLADRLIARSPSASLAPAGAAS